MRGRGWGIVGGLLLAAGCLGGPADQRAAALGWREREITVTPTAEATSATVTYRFTNRGPAPITLTAVRADCDCTVPQADRRPYRPRESGTVTVTFTFGARVGPQRRTITVATDDPRQPVTTLTLLADIPEPLRITPAFLLWRIGEPPLPKTFTVTAVRQRPIRLADARSDDPRLVPTLELVVDGAVYRVVVTPATLSEPVSATISMTAFLPTGSPRTVKGYALVKR